MNIFDNLNLFGRDNQVVGLMAFKQLQTQEIENPEIYTGDYAALFKFQLDKKINPAAGQNLYYLS